MPGLQGLSGLGGGQFYSLPWVNPAREYASQADTLGVDQYTWDSPPSMPWLFSGEYVPPPSPVLGVEGVPAVLGAGSDPGLWTAPIETGSHSAPFPAFSVDDSIPYNTEYNSAQLAESWAIHGMDTGQDQVYREGPEPANPWQRDDINYLTSGQTMLTPDVPDQLRGNLGGDHVQGFEPDARYGFGEGFVRMAAAHSDVAGNYLWLTPTLQPVEVRPTGYRSWPVGAQSPFAGQVPGTMGPGAVEGAVITTAPPEYVPPPEPAVAQPLPASSAAWSTW